MDNERFTVEQKTEYVCRIKLAVVILAAFLLQNTSGLFPRPWGVPAMLLVPAVVCIGMFRREVGGMGFGLLAGALLDAFSADSLCFHSIALTLIGFLSGLLITRLLRNNLKTCLLLCAAALVLYNTAYFAVCVWPSAKESAWYVYSNIYLASVIYSGLFVPVFYGIVRAVALKRRTEA